MASGRDEPPPPRSGPFWLRVLALALVLLGGLSTGRVLSNLELGSGSRFASLYAAAWCVREGVPLTVLYDDRQFARAVRAVDASRPHASFGLRPPAAALVALPVSSLAPRLAGGVWAWTNLALFLGGLLLLGSTAGRQFWNRHDWLALTGAGLLSAPWLECLRAGELCGGPFFLACVAAWSWERGRPERAIVPLALAFGFTLWSPVYPLAAGADRRFRWALLWCLVVLLVFGASLWGLGLPAHGEFVKRVWRGIGSSSLPALLSAAAAAAAAVVLLVWSSRGRVGAHAPLHASTEARVASPETPDLSTESSLGRAIPFAATTALAAAFAAAHVVSGLFVLISLWTALRIAVVRDAGPVRWILLAAATWFALSKFPGALLTEDGSLISVQRAAGALGLWFWIYLSSGSGRRTDLSVSQRLESPSLLTLGKTS